MMRMAIVQMDYNASAYLNERNYLQDPVSHIEDNKGISTLKIPKYQTEIASLQRRIENSYVEMLKGKLERILSYCFQKRVNVLVFPEYSIPAPCLPMIKEYAERGMIIVAGSHTILSKNEKWYRMLGARPEEGTATSFIFFPNGKVDWIEKLTPSPWEGGVLELGGRWHIIKPQPDLSFLVFLGIDFVNEEHKNRERYVKNKHFYEADFVIISSYTPEIPDFYGKIDKFIKDHKYMDQHRKVTLYTNVARCGGSRIFCHTEMADDLTSIAKNASFQLPTGDEGIVIIDCDIKPKKQFVREQAVQVCIAPFIYVNTLHGYEKFISQYREDGKTLDKRINVIQQWEGKIFEWWKSKEISRSFAKKMEVLLCDYHRLSSERLDFLLDALLLPRGIPKIDEWRFTTIGEIIEFLEGLQEKDKEGVVAESIKFYKRQQQILKRRVREEFLDAFYLNKKRVGELAEMKVEEYGWLYKDFETLPTIDVKEKIIFRPLLNKSEVEHCFIVTKKIKEFLERFEFRNYLFLSPQGSGKTSLLSYLSMKAISEGLHPLWIQPNEIIPTVEILFKKLDIKEPGKYVFVFDDVHKNEKCIDLLYELNRRFPNVSILCSADSERFSEIKEKWKKISRVFQQEKLPGLLEKEDIEKFLPGFDNMISEKGLKLILTHGEFPILHLVAIHRKLTLDGKNKDDVKIIEGVPLEGWMNYLQIYSSLNDGERFVMKVIAYLDGVTEELLKDVLKKFGASDKIIEQLLKKKLIYKEFTCRVSPGVRALNFLNTFDGLKEVVKNVTYPYEVSQVLPNLLLEINSYESVVALINKYESFNATQKDTYIDQLIEKKDDPLILWMLSTLTKTKIELLELSEYVIEKFDKEPDENLGAVLYNFGCAYIEIGQIDNAINCYDKALLVCRDDPTLWYNLGIAWNKKGDLTREIEYFQRAISIDPNNAKSYYFLGVAYGRKGDKEKEMEYFKKAVEIDSSDAGMWYNLGIAYGRDGNKEEEMKCFEKVMSLGTRDSVIWYNMGVAYGKKGDLEQEIKCYGKALQLDPNYTLAWYGLGVAYQRSEDLERGIKCFARAILLDSEFGAAWYGLGDVYRRSGKIGKALSCFERATEIDPEDGLAWYHLGLMYREKGRKSRALSCFEKSTKLRPEDAMAWYNLGVCYREKGIMEKALSCFERAKELKR